MNNIFTKHPRSIGESYWKHGLSAFGFAGQMLFASIACMIHALFPFLFEKTASNCLFKLVGRILERIPNNDPRFIQLKLLMQQKNIVL